MRVLVLRIAYLEVKDRRWGLALVVQRPDKVGALKTSTLGDTETDAETQTEIMGYRK